MDVECKVQRCLQEDISSKGEEVEIMMMLGPSLILASFSDSPFLLASHATGLSMLALLFGSLCMMESHVGGLFMLASIGTSLDSHFFGLKDVIIIAITSKCDCSDSNLI